MLYPQARHGQSPNWALAISHLRDPYPHVAKPDFYSNIEKYRALTESHRSATTRLKQHWDPSWYRPLGGIHDVSEQNPRSQETGRHPA
jgi:hypothetical protein